MVVWSSISKVFSPKNALSRLVSKNNVLNKKIKDVALTQVRHGGGHGPKTFNITPSDWQWDKFKDLVHFYFMVGIIPVTLIITYTNIFIGPAKLTAIPEGYEPEHWEYYSHPITRFIARYIKNKPQQEYEKYCHEVFQESEKMRLRRLEKEIKEKMAERLDYQSWYYRPAMVKYARSSKAYFEEDELRLGS